MKLVFPGKKDRKMERKEGREEARKEGIYKITS